ncbi:MAG: hypothetical protein ACHQLQ_01710 [Candidatus Acidiferrales bacterium]
MNRSKRLPERGNHPTRTELRPVPIVLLALFFAVAMSLPAQDKKSSGSEEEGGAGLIVSSKATAKEVGLPIYPGARPHKDEGNNSHAAQLGLWGNTFGFKLVVLKMESNDAPGKIAAFYQKALGKYGKVLNCTNAAPGEEKQKGKSASELDCGDDKPEEGGQLFKSGTKEKQHLVSVQPNGPGSIFQLVYVEARGEQKPL